jgi:hypothetical protein
VAWLIIALALSHAASLAQGGTKSTKDIANNATNNLNTNPARLDTQ